jgi:type IV secretory pathway VirB3-like protein
MRDTDTALDETPVRIAGTRPAIKFGLPIYMWSGLLVLATELAAAHKLWAALYVTLSVGLAAWLAFKTDHNIARVEAAYWKTRGCDVQRLWRGGRSSVSALPIKPGWTYRGIPESGWRANDAGV